MIQLQLIFFEILNFSSKIWSLRWSNRALTQSSTSWRPGARALAPSPARPRRHASATICRWCPYRPTVKSPWAQLASPDSQVTRPISPAHWQLATRRPPAPPSQHSAGADPLSAGKPPPVLRAVKSMFPGPLGDAFCRCHLAPAPAVFPGRPARRHVPPPDDDTATSRRPEGEGQLAS